jgi:PEGA domain
MTPRKRVRPIVAAAVALLGAALLLPQGAEAHGRGGFHGRPVIRLGGFYGFPAFPYYGFDYGYGFGFGPYFGPNLYRPEGGIDLNVAMMAGYGAVDLNVKPGQAEVWVDGKYVGEARDLDGYPSFLWLEQGTHRVAIYKGGYATFDEVIQVQRGLKKDLKVRLEKGESERPGPPPEGTR